MHRKTGLSLLAVLMLFLITSCDRNRIYEENLAVKNNAWNKDDIKTFTFEVADTMSKVNIFINMRTTEDYPYSNIYMFMNSEYPDGQKHEDTLEFILAQPDGKWNGEATGTIIQFKGLISSGYRFSKAGKYTFQLQHAMRETDLKEIVDVGMRVETMEN